MGNIYRSGPPPFVSLPHAAYIAIVFANTKYMEYDGEILMKFLLALLWGGLVGAEREYRSKSAGFRTMIMISLGACFFTMMSILIGGGVSADRIASNIVTGIGFLGAGVIFRGDNRVNGITTAATIWAVAAIGMGIGGGYYFASFCASMLILFVLAILPYFERLIDHFNRSRIYSIRCNFSQDTISVLEAEMRACNLRYKLVKQMKDEDILILSWEVHGHAKNHDLLTEALTQDARVKRFEY